MKPNNNQSTDGNSELSTINSISALRNALNEINSKKHRTDSKLAGIMRGITKSKTSDERKLELFQSFELPDKERALKSFIKLADEELEDLNGELNNIEKPKLKETKQELIDLLSSMCDEADNRLQIILEEKSQNSSITNIVQNISLLDRVKSFLHDKQFKQTRAITACLSLMIVAGLSCLGILSYQSHKSDSEVNPDYQVEESAVKVVQKDITTPSTTSEQVSPDLTAIDWSISSYFSLKDVPNYSDKPYVEINNNKPFFNAEQLSIDDIEEYGELDELGRCTQAISLLSSDKMPTEPRGEIGQVKPTGWHTVKYADVIEDLYLYNRCHLIAYELTGQNDNVNNLITGTRYMNIEGMLPFENMLTAYLNGSTNHVLYRVTPIFEGNNLLASGVLMEAKSVEDNGADISFCVYCYNVQPNITISYADGSSELSVEYTAKKEAEEKKQQEKKTEKQTSVQESAPTDTAQSSTVGTNSANSNVSPESNTNNSTSVESDYTVYITNTGTKYHRYGCRYLKSEIAISVSEAKARGYEPCDHCCP